MKNTTEYTYTFANGETVTLGREQISEEWIHILEEIVMVKHFCNIYGSKNAEWLSLVYWDCLVYPAIRASYGVRYPL